MRKDSEVLISALICLVLMMNGTASSTPAAAGAQYYVSTTGHDSGKGSATRPWKTIQYASFQIGPGSTVHVAPGNYIGQIVTRTSGKPDARIVYLSDVKWGAHIISPDGGETAAWQNYGDYVDIVGFDVTGNGNVGLFNKASFTRIMNNHVHNIPASPCAPNGGAGIANGNYSATDADIIGNVVHDIGTPGQCRYVHGIYHSVSRGHVLNNISYHNATWGIQLWHAATDVVISNNTVVGNGVKNEGGGMNIGAGDKPGGITTDNCIVTNNIIAFNGGIALREWGRVGDRNRYQNNLIFNNGGGFKLQGPHKIDSEIVADPQFVSAGTGDFHLRSTSAAIDRGTALGAPSTDIDGGPRPIGRGYDIGAYEFGSRPAGYSR